LDLGGEPGSSRLKFCLLELRRDPIDEQLDLLARQTYASEHIINFIIGETQTLHGSDDVRGSQTLRAVELEQFP